MTARDNPFATDRLARELPFDPSWCGTDWESLDRTLTRQRYRGQIVGPHGSGKTTLLDALEPRLRAGGWRVTRWLFRDERPAPDPSQWTSLADLGGGDILLIDGAERLGFSARRRLRRAEPRLGGFLVTGHRPFRHLPRWIETRSSPAMLAAFIARAAPGFPLDGGDIARLHADCRGNLREALWRCYDLAARLDRV